MTPSQKLINEKSNELFRLIEQEETKFFLKDFNKSLKDSEIGEITVTVASNYLIYSLAHCIASDDERQMIMKAISDRMAQVLPSAEKEEVH